MGHIKKDAANIWEHKVDNNTNFANFVCLSKTRIETCPTWMWYVTKDDYYTFLAEWHYHSNNIPEASNDRNTTEKYQPELTQNNVVEPCYKL